jgi:predicted ATPase
MTPFVGREHEVALLMDRWRDAVKGEGQVTLLSGEAPAGISPIPFSNPTLPKPC